MSGVSTPDGLRATLSFIDKKSVTPGQKIYGLDYEPPPGFPQKNFDLENVQVTLNDMRPVLDRISLEREDFRVLNLNSQLQYGDFLLRDRVQSVFADELRVALKDLLGAKEIFFHECVVRKRETAYGTTEATQPFGQPIPTAHSDYTREEAIRILERLSDGAKLPETAHIQALNVWKPLKGPLKDWPLAVCDMSSIDRESDLSRSDAVSPDGIVEAYVGHYNPNQRWYYLSDHLDTELIVFRTVDMQKAGTVLHCAFNNPKCPEGEEPRESIEFRVFAIY